MADSVVTDEMRASLGVEGEAIVLEVTTTGIRMYAQAVGYRDALFYDEGEARRRGYRDLVAPPGYLGTPRALPPADTWGPVLEPPNDGFTISYKRILNAGTRHEYFEPVVAGDLITSRSKLTDLQERTGSIGPMLIAYRETAYTNQHGVLVAKMQSSRIYY